MVLFDGTLPPIDPSAPYTFRDAVDAYGTRGVGECVGGQLHGKGRREYADGTVHTGGFARGKADGSGACHYANGDVYDGQFARGERSGEGVLRWAAGHTYEGAWAADEPDGVGTMVWVDADREEVKRYAGQWRHGRRHGAGVQTWADGKQHGTGRMRWARKAQGPAETKGAGEEEEEPEEEFVGEWWRGVQQGHGTWRAADGVCGAPARDLMRMRSPGRPLRPAAATLTRVSPPPYANAGRRFDGEWQRGVAQGRGRVVHAGGAAWEGQFEAGRPHGVGRLHYAGGGPAC